MADTVIHYQQIRMDVRDPQVTHVYVLVENMSRDGFPVGGWYTKSFPARMSTLEIMQAWADGKEEPIMWARGRPPDDLRAGPGPVPTPPPRLKPLVFDEDGNNVYGFSITHDPDDDPEKPYLAVWGEGDECNFATREEAKAWCEAELLAWVTSMLEP